MQLFLFCYFLSNNDAELKGGCNPAWINHMKQLEDIRPLLPGVQALLT